MASWSDLSIDVKQKIVGELDFLSRQRFATSSKSNQSVTQATPLFLPRVNFVEKKGRDKFTVKFYLGIENYVQLDIRRTNGQCQKGECNITDCPGHDIQILKIRKKPKLARREKSIIVKWAESPVQIACYILKNVVMNEATILGGFEIGLADIHSKTTFDKIFGEREIRAQILTLRTEALPILARCRAEDIQEIQAIMDKMDKNLAVLVPCRSREVEEIYRKDRGVWEHLDRDSVVILRLYQNTKVTYHGGREDVLFRELSVNPDRIIYEKHVYCGTVIECIMKAYSCSDPFTEVPPAHQECQMRWSCSVHSDPFVHWYYTSRIKGPNIEAAVLVPYLNGEILKNYSNLWKERYHKQRFGNSRSRFFWMKIVAVLVLILSILYSYFMPFQF